MKPATHISRSIRRIGATLLGVLLFVGPVYLVPIAVIMWVEFPQSQHLNPELVGVTMLVCGIAMWAAAGRLLLFGYSPRPMRQIFDGWFRKPKKDVRRDDLDY